MSNITLLLSVRTGETIYEKLGFKKEGEEFEEAGIMHFKMYLKK